MPDPDWWEALWPDPSGTAAALGVAPGMRVVDLCCGDGLFTLPVAQLAAEVVAIDLDREMLDRTRARLDAANVSNCRVVEGDAYDIVALAGEPADMVIMANTFHGVPDKAGLGQAIASALKPGGRFVVVNWHRRPREETTVLGRPRGPKTEMRMEPEEVAASVEQSGLSLTDVVELPPYHYAAVLQRGS
jgi:ubiquinone/menaquinone biosynthesis C-methylase UbiE